MLKISRPDVDRTDITYFPVEDRFLKLPIENYLAMLEWEGKNVYDELNDPQVALINAINNPKYRFVCAALSRRLGKTFIANVIGQLVVLIPNCHVLIISPNFNLSSISFDLQRKLIKHFDIEVAKNNLKDRVVELENGSSIRMGSVATVDSSVGRSYTLIIFDEAALGATDAENAFNVSLRPTLDRPNSKAIFISTPRGKNNWFSRFWDRGWDDRFPEWVSLQADYHENPRMTEKDVTEARHSMSEAEFAQEYLASFTVFEGQIYSLPETSVVPFVRADEMEFIGGCDPGYKDPTAYVVIAYDPRDQTFHICDEYLQAEATTDKHAVAIHRFINEYNIDLTFIDPAAAQFANDLAYLYEVPTRRAKKDVLPGIAYVQTLVEQHRLKVDPKCKHTLQMFDQYQWDNRETLVGEKPKHTIESHIADAIRYALYTYQV